MPEWVIVLIFGIIGVPIATGIILVTSGYMTNITSPPLYTMELPTDIDLDGPWTAKERAGLTQYGKVKDVDIASERRLPLEDLS